MLANVPAGTSRLSLPPPGTTRGARSGCAQTSCEPAVRTGSQPAFRSTRLTSLYFFAIGRAYGALGMALYAGRRARSEITSSSASSTKFIATDDPP
jgi:hypothetical protein